MPTYSFPTSSQIRQIEQILLPRLEEGRVGLSLMPTASVDEDTIIWEQLDNFVGLQAIRGLNGQPSSVKKTGAARYSMRPGVYGEFEYIAEDELTRLRELGSFGQPIDISTLVARAQTKLLQRRLDRIENIVWTLLTTGTFSVSNGAGILHTDTFGIQTFTASPQWSNASTSTPLADFRAVQLKARGQSIDFGRRAVAYLNQKTANLFLANTNSADLGGYKVAGNFGKLVNMDANNEILAANNLPQIQVYDGGYLNDSGTFTAFIPDNYVVVIGARSTGVAVGEYQYTRNANNPDLSSGAYTRVIDRGELSVPRSIEVHDGHNGGPALFYPGAICAMSV